MTVGVFGKLPAKRDFVQNGLSTGLMNILDPWLQAAVAQSRQQLGEGWLQQYLYAPIWRFWMGNRVAGNSVMGATRPVTPSRLKPNLCTWALASVLTLWDVTSAAKLLLSGRSCSPTVSFRRHAVVSVRWLERVLWVYSR